MKHISWFLVVLTLALGCGRDKQAWAQKIDKLVQRAYACKDVACAKQVEEEIGTIIATAEIEDVDVVAEKQKDEGEKSEKKKTTKKKSGKSDEAKAEGGGDETTAEGSAAGDDAPTET